MRYTDLTNDELDSLVEMIQAFQAKKVSLVFLNTFVGLLKIAVACRLANK